MSLDQQYFDDLYGASGDPWQFRSRPYEARKRALTMASLPEAHYGRVFEPGCSLGLLTEELAARSDYVLAMDISPVVLACLEGRLPQHVELRHGSVPDDWPDGHFDLVVLSEVGYYLSRSECRRLAHLATGSASEVLAVHWRHPVADYPLPGDAVHDLLDARARATGMVHLVEHREADFRLDLWAVDGRSVAQRTGVDGS
jgi:SAM-dependent methyltransferase